MRRHTKSFVFFLLFLGLSLGGAEAEEILTWEECILEARQNHPELISAEEQLNQAKANKVIARSDVLPQISGSVSGRTAKAASAATTDTYAYSLSGEQLLFDGMKTAHEIAAATADVKAAQYSYDATSADIRLGLREAFIELLKAQELVQITEDIAQRRKQNLELVELRYEAGREHKGSLLTAKANLAQAEYEVAQGRRNIALAQRELTKELGRRQLTPLTVKADFEIKDLARDKPDFECLAKVNPLLLELIAEKEAARLDLKSAKADFFPEVRASASIGRSDSYWPPRNEVWSAGASFSLPIFEGGSRFAQVSRARAVLNQAKAEERSGKDSVVVSLEQDWKGFQDALDKVEVQKKFLEAAEERAKITQAQYSTGLISFDNWTIIEDDLVSAKKSYLDAQADALVAEASWIQAKGGTLDYE